MGTLRRRSGEIWMGRKSRREVDKAREAMISLAHEIINNCRAMKGDAMAHRTEPAALDPSTFPGLHKPFSVLAFGDRDVSTIIDREGRVLMFEQHNLKFVAELCKVMNENSERLEKAWKEGAGNGV